jgi:choline dehydrogenase-like flavoprotein
MTGERESGVSWLGHAGHYDVLVVGSGFGGSVTAPRLTGKATE